MTFVNREQAEILKIEKIAEWLLDHPPFVTRDDIMSLSTGVVGSANISCYKAAEIGSQTMEKFIGTNFADMMQSKNRIIQ